MPAKKLSEAIKEMAESILKDPATPPTSEAAHAAILFAHLAWNKALLPEAPVAAYRPLLKKFLKSNRKLWRELTSDDPEVLIAALRTYKEKHFPHDRRWIVACGMRPVGNIQVEWAEEPPPLDAVPRPVLLELP